MKTASNSMIKELATFISKNIFRMEHQNFILILWQELDILLIQYPLQEFVVRQGRLGIY